MIARINLREINDADRFAPDKEYTHWKAECAVASRPSVYRVEGDFLIFDTDKVPLSVEDIKMHLQWGVQRNSWQK